MTTTKEINGNNQDAEEGMPQEVQSTNSQLGSNQATTKTFNKREKEGRAGSTTTPRSNRVTTTREVSGTNQDTEETMPQEVESVSTQLGNNQGTAKTYNKEETKMRTDNSPNEDPNECPHQENKTRVTRALKPQRNCPKSKNEDFLWN